MKKYRNVSMALLAALPFAAQAHTHLKQASPADGSVLAKAPDQIMLVFSEAATVTALSIQRAGDKEPQKLGSLPKAPSEHLTVALPKLTDGAYTLSYRVVSDDNHVMAGKIHFTVSTPASPKR
jgi:methionine-rich copper-binding protein CopC